MKNEIAILFFFITLLVFTGCGQRYVATCNAIKDAKCLVKNVEIWKECKNSTDSSIIYDGKIYCDKD